MHLVTLASEVRAAPRQNMKPVLGVALQYLLLFLPSAAVPRKRGIGGGLWQAEELEITFPKELEEKEDESTYEGAEPSFMALTSKATAVPHPLLKSDQPGDYAKGAKCPQLFPEEAVSPVVGLESSLPAWLPDRLEGPVCTVRMSRRYGLDQSLLEVVGVLTSYESDFLKLVRHASWDQGQLQTFGICPAGETHSALLSLKHIHAHLAEPGESRFLVLHLEEVTWDAETKLRFTLALQEEVGRSFGEVQSALLVFYLGSRESKARETLLAAGDGLLQKQALCLSRATRYLLLRALVTPATRTPRQLSFHVSLAIRRHGDGGPLLPTSEVQRLLFGADEKCFTRMTPALLLLEKRKVSRQTRSAGPQAYCRLQELMIDLHYDKFVILPDKYMANNCEGPCRRPLSTRIPDYSSHSVLLVDMQERGAPLQRRPCCVPVKYSDKEIISMTAEGVQVTTFPNMVAEECGCR
uniref:Muellerian-inhibiting factor n=1 Tax=Pelodiscus sinensis TaxID=13735 RepID=A0A3G1PW81_PELSI|nr:muellerian-inhibiting factor [Pelodiscus sinensis]AVR54985.1 anti-Mullerian hormone [Pelodiscus sinensis]|eukprot:XP_006129061.1 muellerian-inhibiting factor [Pelodiscus sinensis]